LRNQAFDCDLSFLRSFLSFALLHLDASRSVLATLGFGFTFRLLAPFGCFASLDFRALAITTQRLTELFTQSPDPLGFIRLTRLFELVGCHEKQLDFIFSTWRRLDNFFGVRSIGAFQPQLPGVNGVLQPFGSLIFVSLFEGFECHSHLPDLLHTNFPLGRLWLGVGRCALLFSTEAPVFSERVEQLFSLVGSIDGFQRSDAALECCDHFFAAHVALLRCCTNWQPHDNRQAKTGNRREKTQRVENTHGLTPHKQGTDWVIG
jgi:hypothetical protein